MPKGFKLELEENLVKYMETTKPPPKKNKTNVYIKSFFFQIIYCNCMSCVFPFPILIWRNFYIICIECE